MNLFIREIRLSTLKIPHLGKMFSLREISSTILIAGLSSFREKAK